MSLPKIMLEELLQNNFPGAVITVTDLVGDGDHYEAIIVSQVFQGKSKIQQHRMVNEALKDILGDQLHALSIKTLIGE